MSRCRRAALLGCLAFGIVACTGDPVDRLTDDERVDRLQDLLVRGTAHAEIDEWAEAIELFNQATKVADNDAVVAFDLGVAYFRSGELEKAAEWLDRVGGDAPAELRARVEYVRGKLALERSDAQAEAEAYRRAAELDPEEPGYLYALSQVVPRLGGDDVQTKIGELLERAVALWPANGRLGAELAQWSLGRDDPEVRRRGVDLVVELARGQPEVEALVERGLEELGQSPDRTPVSLRRALNLLRPGKRFQTDSAALEARLAVLPLATPVTAALGRRSSPWTVDIVLEEASLLPEASLSAGPVLDVRFSNDAVEGLENGLTEASLTVLTGDDVWFLDSAGGAVESLRSFEGSPWQVLIGELDGDGWMETLILSDDGVSLWGRKEATEWSERPLESALGSAAGLRDATLVDFEHDGDLDLLAIDASGQLMLVTHRGESGLGAPAPAPLPDVGAVSITRSADLDGDVDQDLLIGANGTLRVLTNWRQGEFRLSQQIEVGDFQDLLTFDYDGDGRFDVVGIVDGALIFLNNKGTAGLAADEEAGERVEALINRGRVDAVAAADMDLDGGLDLLVAHSDESGASTLSVLREQGGPGLAGQVEIPGGSVRGVAALDLDGDHDPDPIVWGEPGITTFRSSGAESQGWLGVRLRGLMGKVPLDGRGARVDVNFGLDARSFEVERPEIIIGLGGRTPSLLEVTWPNGISEFLFEPPANAMHLIEQELRIEGSCPFLYASDGSTKRFVTDILGLAPLGMLAAPGVYVPPDPEEYLRLPDWVASDGSVELSITEELREVAYLDQVELVVVDAPGDVEAYNGERWIQGFVEGLDLRLLTPLERPTSVLDARGRNVLEVVADLDHDYLTNHEGDRLYQGAVPAHTLEIEIPSGVAASGRAALVMTGWLHWGNTSTNVARGQDPAGAQVFPVLEIPAGDGVWRRVDLDVGLPAGKTKPIVVDLSGLVDPGDPRVRLTTDFEVYWDQIAVAEALSSDALEHRIHRLEASVAELSYGGFSRWYRPTENGPYLFDYSDRRGYPWRETASGVRPIAWQEHEGFYTGFGPVTDLVSAIDDRLVVFGAGEELTLSFDTSALPALPDGWRRTLFLHSEGWEKDGDPNIACGQTVGPLPFRGMEAYPCPQVAGLVEDDSELGASSGEANDRRDRWVDRSRLERRVAASARGRE